mgnify:CR=1 FL=1
MALKRIIFVSTGRCGTKRLYEILNNYVSKDFYVCHQMKFSRITNVLGTLCVMWNSLHFPLLYKIIIRVNLRKEVPFITTDPLSSMLLPNEYIHSASTAIIHLYRSDESFAKSIFQLSRSRRLSFIAHNLIPFWQPLLWPLENLLNKEVLVKYERINRLKNDFFFKRYGRNPHYRQIYYKEIFEKEKLESLINELTGQKINIPDKVLSKKSNESKR